MKKISIFLPTTLFFIGSCYLLTILTGCGRNEAAGGAVGAAGGAMVGAAVAGPRNTGVGALVGALVGNIVGRGIGESEDHREQKQERQRERAYHERELAYLEAENVALQRKLIKWCNGCGRKETMASARRCVACGDELIHEKYCGSCKTAFSPNLRYRYCPHCKDRILLCGR